MSTLEYDLKDDEIKTPAALEDTIVAMVTQDQEESSEDTIKKIIAESLEVRSQADRHSFIPPGQSQTTRLKGVLVIATASICGYPRDLPQDAYPEGTTLNFKRWLWKNFPEPTRALLTTMVHSFRAFVLQGAKSEDHEATLLLRYHNHMKEFHAVKPKTRHGPPNVLIEQL